MVLRSTQTLPHRSVEKATASSTMGRGELSAAIVDLAAKVEKLSVRVDRIVALVNVGKVTCRSKVRNRFGTVAGTDLARDLRGGGTAETTNFPLSPNRDSWICNAYPGEFCDEVNSTIEVTEFDRKEGVSRAKNAIAGRVLDLHDRLGGFIKPLPPRHFDQKS